MSQDEQDLAIGRATRELKQLKREATAQRLEIQRIGHVLESLGQGLQLLPERLTEDQERALDAPRLATLLKEHATLWKRVEQLEQQLKAL